MVFFLIECASTPEKSAIEFAENIGFYKLDTEIPIEQYSYIYIRDGIYINNIDNEERPFGFKHSFIASGYHDFGVQYRAGTAFSDFVHISHNFEAGKYYYLDYEIEGIKINFSITEMNDSNNVFGKARKYLEFFKTNPNYLDGIWERKKYPMKPVQVTFNGGRITFKRTTNFKTTTEVIEGHYIFDEKTIIIFHDSYVINGKESNFDLKLGQEKQIVWYYELKDNVFNIIKAPWIGSPLTYDSINGLYNKNDH
jgi:hypothetical protein